MLGAVIASLVLAGGSLPEPPEAWLEAELRRRYTTVTEWRIREIVPQRVSPEIEAERFELGVAGARSLVLVRGRDGTGRPVLERRWYEVAGFGPSLVVTRPLAALTTLTADMVDAAPADLMAQPCAPLRDRAFAVGLRLLQSRRQGEALCASMLGPVPAVARGKTVVVEVTAGDVVLRVEAVAQADAGLGDRVRLARSTNPNSFWGVVSAPGEVRIDE